MNELPLNFFIFLVVLQFLAAFYTILTITPDFPHIFTAATSGLLGYVNANMILNGNVVTIAATTTTTTYIKIQSIPVHYLLLGFAVCMSLIAVYLVVAWIMTVVTDKKEQDFFSFEGFS